MAAVDVDADTAPRPTRHNAFGTLSIVLRWALGSPALLVLYLAGGVLAAFGGLSPAVGIVVCLLLAFASGVAHLSAERFVADRRPDARSVVRTVCRRFPALLVLTALYTAVVAVGLALFVLPGLYLLVRLLPAFPACILDGTGPVESLAVGWRVGGDATAKLAGISALAFALTIATLVPVVLVDVDAATTALLGQVGVAIDGLSFLAALLTSVCFLLLVELAATRVYLEYR